MNFPDEIYARLFLRDTMTWLSWDWETQSIFCLLLRKFDRSGVLDLGRFTPIDGVSMALRAANGPPPAETIARVLEALFESGTIVHRPGKLVMPNYLFAQECGMSDRLRKQLSREKRLADALSVENLEMVGHSTSQMVTVGHSFLPSSPSLNRSAQISKTKKKISNEREIKRVGGKNSLSPFEKLPLEVQKLAAKCIDEATAYDGRALKRTQSEANGLMKVWTIANGNSEEVFLKWSAAIKNAAKGVYPSVENFHQFAGKYEDVHIENLCPDCGGGMPIGGVCSHCPEIKRKAELKREEERRFREQYLGPPVGAQNVDVPMSSHPTEPIVVSLPKQAAPPPRPSPEVEAANDAGAFKRIRDELRKKKAIGA